MKSVHSKHWQWNKSVLLANVLHLCSESDVMSRVKNRQRQVLIRTVILCECTYGRKKFKEGRGWGAGATELSALAHAGLRCFSLAEHHSEVARLADGFEVGRWLMGEGGVILAPWLPFADLGALAWRALWHVVQLSECRERMQQQSRLPLRRMKAQIFSCVIWKVASSIILWAHAGTDEEEEDEHYVFTTALNTAPPGVLFLFHHTPFLRCVQWACGRGWIRGLTKMLHSSNVGNIYVLLQCLLGYNELSERRVVCTAVLLKHLPEQPRCSSTGNNRLSCFHSHSCAHVCIRDSKRCDYHILTVH